VHWFLYSSGKPLNNDFDELLLKDEIKPLPPEPKEFSYDVLDLALLTKDEEWYNEIVNLKGEGVE
jgi:hypothetical protein